MNRRSFLASTAAIIASAAFDPEKLLWVPGRKVISIPKPSPPAAAVYLNGIYQVTGVDYTIDGNKITFHDPRHKKDRILMCVPGLDIECGDFIRVSGSFLLNSFFS